jgi:hypothetical protein
VQDVTPSTHVLVVLLACLPLEVLHVCHRLQCIRQAAEKWCSSRAAAGLNSELMAEMAMHFPYAANALLHVAPQASREIKVCGCEHNTDL